MALNELLATDGTNHGSAYYMLTGTDDFEYVLDIMKADSLITNDDIDSYLSGEDGYRLRFMMVGMKTALDTSGDLEAICLASTRADGVLCAGMRYNGSSIVTWSEWYTNGAFTSAVSSEDEPYGGEEQSEQWFKSAEDGSQTLVVDGTDDAFWSVFKFQPLEDPKGYDYDYRFSPLDDDVKPYIYKRDEGAGTHTFYEGTTI